MHTFKWAIAYAKTRGVVISRVDLDAALRDGEFPSAGTLPTGEPVLEDGELDDWLTRLIADR